MSDRSSQWFCDGQNVPPLDDHGDCRLVGGRVVWVCKCIPQTISTHPAVPNLVMDVDLSSFPSLSGKMCHLGGAWRCPSRFRADQVFLRVLQEGNLTHQCRMWGHPTAVV